MHEKKPLNMYAYEKLKEMILNNEFKAGSHLEEKDLCELLSISRTPLREAINRLAYENLVQTIPKKGIFVTELSIQFITELFQARKLIEPIVVVLSAKNLNKDRLMDLRRKNISLINSEDIMGLHKLDYELHEYLNSRCDNQHLLKSITYISDQFQRVRTQDFYPRERALKGANEHITIIDSLVNEDFDSLPQLIQTHITSTESFYFKNLLRPNPIEDRITNALNHMDSAGETTA
ncbi:GntR family transcriptional regulator [Clostridium sp. AM58-1XD]|uniref:GntR family transcriptional regulator n=1 Tax=Clostridium sp. AM58-1XD TaxID=2292307 RepID=UPI000E4FFC36|nr:GntR family transcriptional regulator [Clostridium sp. AM58-1XD]RGY97792.1 GntR family transcriptional regulator [Clostridium sp. AM58-1XD]